MGEVSVGESTSGREESLAPGCRLLHGQHMRSRNVPDVYPEIGPGLGDVLLPTALDHIDEALVGSIDRRQRLQMMDYRPEHERGADGRQVEVGLVVVEKLPCCLLGNGFRRPIRLDLVALEAILVRVWVPVGLGEDGCGIGECLF